MVMLREYIHYVVVLRSFYPRDGFHHRQLEQLRLHSSLPIASTSRPGQVSPYFHLCICRACSAFVEALCARLMLLPPRRFHTGTPTRVLCMVLRGEFGCR